MICVCFLGLFQYHSVSLHRQLTSHLVQQELHNMNYWFAQSKTIFFSCLQWIPVATTLVRTQECVWDLVQTDTNVTALALASMETTVQFVSPAKWAFNVTLRQIKPKLHKRHKGLTNYTSGFLSLNQYIPNSTHIHIDQHFSSQPFSTSNQIGGMSLIIK